MKTTRKWPIPRRCDWKAVRHLFQKYHGYKDAGNAGEVWACFERGKAVAAWTWQPPPPGAARLIAPECPSAVLSLSRMVATPRGEREWHISKPLRWIMRHGLDRGRWPSLITYADTGEGHSGHVYKCSGWKKDGEVESVRYGDPKRPEVRRSIYAAGKRKQGLVVVGRTVLIRFVHRVCPKGQEKMWIAKHGWRREFNGKYWRNGAKQYEWVRQGKAKGFFA